MTNTFRNDKDFVVVQVACTGAGQSDEREQVSILEGTIAPVGGLCTLIVIGWSAVVTLDQSDDGG